MKKFYRSKTDRRIAGICGGLAKYFGLDANLVRFALLLLAVLTGFLPTIIAYIVAAIIIPEEETDV